ncbi:S-layer homology domain-containing protein [Solibacillus silvestris]|uniref:S-layer homology domain-containing protein n=1 Tax=Solibacillus silvestris TaxID=76853 RepID=UPI003F7DD93D
MAKSSKATKAVLASLLATSAIVPAMAVSAEAGGETTRTGEAATAAAAKTIDFKVEDATGQLAKYVPGTGNLVERGGQKYIQLNLAENVLAMIEEVLVDGKTAVYNYGSKMILIPISDDFKTVEATFTLNTPAGKMDAKGTITPDAKSIKEAAETAKPSEEAKEEKVFTVGKTFESVADGTYDIKWDAYKEKVGNYKAISSHFSPDAKLIVKDGKYSVQLTVTESSKSMVQDVTIAGKNAVAENGIVTIEIPSISDLHEASVHVVVPAMNMDKPYPFGFAVETANLELPKADAATVPTTPAATTEPVYVYKDGTKELSIMQGKYLTDKVTITATEGGYDVDVTFPEGQWINEFKVEGATVALKSEETVDANKVKIYTVSVKDLSKLYTASLDLSVNQGPVVYNSVHEVQLQFGGKQATDTTTAVPFKDIASNGNKDAIINLYNKGIFKGADKFNPGNNLTRSQFALMLNRALNLDIPAAQKFADLPKDAEAVKAINALNGYGIINGTSTTTFSPGKDITRKQAALMIYRLLEKNGYQSTGATANFSDMPKDKEAAKAIAELNKLGIISGFEGKFNPENKLTRSQMAKILNNTLTAVDGLKK